MKKRPRPDELPPMLRVHVSDFRKGDPEVVTIMMTLALDNGNAGYKLIGFVLDDDKNETDEMIFERVFGELA